MATLQHPYKSAHYQSGHHESLIHRFFTWCKDQQKNYFAWMAVIVTGHACVITPLTLLFIMITGNNMIFWPMASAAMAMALVVNLAALPTKITIPVFFLSLLIDLIVIVNCISIGFTLPSVP